MTKRSLTILAIAGVCATALGQQTPPIQPKTATTPTLTPLQLPGLPSNNQIIANAPLTAAEAVKIALAHQPQLAITKANADALHGQTLQTRSLLGPTVTATASRNQGNTFKSGTQGLFLISQSDTETQLALNQLVFDFNRTRDMVRQSQAMERAGYRSYDQTLQDVALQAKEDYYAYVQAMQQSKVQEANVQSRQAQVDLTQAQVNAGTGEPVDLVNAKTLAAQGTIQWAQALQAEQTAKVKLSTDMGIDPRTPLVVAPSSEIEVALPADLNSLVDEGLKHRPVVLSAIESLHAAGYGVSVARKNNLPSINFGAGFTTLGVNNPFDAQDGFINLTLSWTLVDSGSMLGKVRQAQAEKSAAAATLRQASQTVIQDVTEAIVGVQTARQQVPVADAEVTDAQEGLRIAMGSYKAGVTTFQTVITAQAALVQAQTDKVNAVAALAIALSTLDHAIGKWPLR